MSKGRYRLFVWTLRGNISWDWFDDYDQAIDAAHDMEQREYVERVRVREDMSVMYETPVERIKSKA